MESKKTKKKKDRVDGIEYQNRIHEVAKAMLVGYTKRTHLFQYIAKKFDWGVSDRQMDNYIRDAKIFLSESTKEEDLKFEKDIASNRLDMLFTMNFKIQDYREARNAVMDKAKLLGILAPIKNDVTTNGKDINEVKPIEVKIIPAKYTQDDEIPD